MKKNRIWLSSIITVILAAIIYYIFYPPINLQNFQFWIFLIVILTIYIIINSFLGVSSNLLNLLKGRRTTFKWKEEKILLLVPMIIVSILIINSILSPFFQAKSYYQRIKIDTGDFEKEVTEVNFQKLPLLDRASTLKIGDRTMGQMSELVSQFDVSNQYTQINYKDEIIRVTPLEYSNIIKWFTNRKEGIKAYITVNSTTGKANLIKLKKGMHYVPSGRFNENLYRKLQFSYPTKNFDSVNFEIDNKGNPYWIASVVKYWGVGLKREVTGAVIFNPISGKSKYYSKEKIPTWVDHVYEADLILEEVSDWGKYQKGFLNSIISQKGVVETTTGYNYLAQDNDIYLYTGITSVIQDESNIGFILTNLRTKETKYYSVAGAEEYSAMDSAKGQVQQMNYTSTFPLLINLKGRPTYLVSLKDNAGLVKMYGFVDVVDYQKVVVTDASKGIEKAAENYLSEIVEDTDETARNQKEITIKDIKTAQIDGNTYYYIIDQENQKYKVSIQKDKTNLPFISINDKITIQYNKEENVINISKIIKIETNNES